MAWASLGVLVAEAAPPVPVAVTANVGSDEIGPFQLANLSVTDPNGTPDLAAYRFVTLPTTGRLYAYNISTGASVEITSANQQVDPFLYPNLVFDPASATANYTVSFQYTAVDEAGEVGTPATYTINVTNATAAANIQPITAERTNVLIAHGFGAQTLSPGLFGVDTDGAVANYSVTPPATGGTLSLDGVAITAARTVSATEATRLAFTPAANFFGTVVIQYRALDNSGAQDGSPANYVIPVAKSGSSKGGLLNFTSRTNLEDWTEARSTTADEVVFNSTYSASTQGKTAFRIEPNPTMPGKALTWSSDYQANATNKMAEANFNFGKALSGFTLSIGDIDISAANTTVTPNVPAGGTWIDRLVFEGFRADGTIVTLTSVDVKPGAAARFDAGLNSLTGTVNTGAATSNSIITFPEPIVRLRIRYYNDATGTDPVLQVVTFDSFSWYTQDVSTVASGPVIANPASTVSYTVVTDNDGPYTAINVVPTLQLVPNLTNVTINGSAAGSSYVSATGLLTLPTVSNLASGQEVTNTVGFTMPNTTVTGTARNTSNSIDEEPSNNNGSLASAQVTTVPNQAPVARNITAPTLSNGSSATPIPSLVANDPNGDNTIVSYLISVPSAGGVLSYLEDNGTTVTISGTSTVGQRTLSPTEIARLSFDPNAGFVGNASFTYTATDDLLLTSNTATYTIPVGAAVGATDLAVTQQVVLGPYVVGDEVVYTITAYNLGTSPALNAQVQDALPQGLTFVSATASTGTSYSNATGVWTITSGVTTFNAGATATLTIRALINREGEFTNTSIVTSSTVDSNPANNEANETINPGTAAYAQDFEGRVVPDNCEPVSTGVSILTGSTALAEGNSLTTGTLSTTASTYTTPFLRLAGNSVLSFRAQASATTNTPQYRVVLVDASGNRTTLQAATNLSATNSGYTLNLTQAGVYRIEIGFLTTANGTSNPTARLDEVLVTNATVASQANCTANVLPVANNVSTRIANSRAATSIPALSGSDTAPGTVDSYRIESILDLNTQGVLTLNGVPLTIGQEILAADADKLQFDPVSGYVGTATFRFSARDNSNELSAAPATYSISVENATSIAGVVFDDVNYGGGAGRSFTEANTSAVASSFANNAIARPNAVVELYDNASGEILETQQTNASGSYQFTQVLSGNYSVRVVNSTVTSVRNSAAVGVVPVQTFVNGATNVVGGVAPSKTDAPANTGSQLLADLTTTNTEAQSVAQVSIPAVVAPVSNVNFGFNFDVVSNTNATGQGSLAQFITNANALPNTNLAQSGTGLVAGRETSIFMISDGRTTGVPAGLRAGVSGGAASGSATITLPSGQPLPVITDAGTTIDGGRQSLVTGNAIASAAELTTGPEVIINFGGGRGLNTSAANTTFAGLGLTNADAGTSNNPAVYFTAAATTGSSLRNSTVYNNGVNVRLDNATGITIADNVIRNATRAAADGIELNGAASNIISNNQILSNAGYGIDFISGANNSNQITGNLFKNNGNATGSVQTSGIGLRSGSGNTIQGNTFTSNIGDGITVLNGQNGNRITQNSFSNNGDLAIDLGSDNSTTGNGVSINDNTDADGGGNTGLNFPVFTQATISGGNLQVTGYAAPGAIIELYVAATDPSNFGEGQVYLTTVTEGSSQDGDGKTASYSGAINGGPNSGSENNQNRFVFSIPLSSLNATQQAALGAATVRLTATASQAVSSTNPVQYNTSEFAGVITLRNGPLPVELVEFTAKSLNADALLTWKTAQEKNNDRFEVERSIDGVNYEKVGQIAGHGTTSAPQNYSYTDANVGTSAAQVYYRLKQIDRDGTTAYSPVRAVSFGKELAQGNLTLYPNPAHDELTVSLGTASQNAMVEVYTVNGLFVRKQSFDAAATTKLNVSSLPQGTYLLKVTTATGSVLTSRFVKN
ncbi:hypothetical protein ASU33_05520 [Solirubrum puertoriconensis]|uniref:Secretion system C-terminal sorting domain-containing protein n=2 Tax=Solirubrum puertoriconensis TaxID=1751427 RepID=A0A9X0HJ02_SOLP1|nr:hypothetical protein ASU33_05520 [Solirubrum puertoriconensis]